MSRVDISDIRGETLLKLIRRTGEVTVEAINDTEDKLDALDEKVEDYVAELRYVDSGLQNQIASNDDDIAELQLTDVSLQSQITSNDSDIAELQSTDVSLQSQIDSNDTDIAELQSTDASLQSQIDSNDGDIAELQSTDVSLQSQITSNDGDITTLQTANSTLSTRLDSLADSMEIYDNSLSVLLDNDTALQSSMNTLTSTVGTLEDTVSAIGITTSGNTATVNGTTADILSTFTSGFSYTNGTATITANGKTTSFTIAVTGRSGWSSASSYNTLIDNCKDDDMVWVTGQLGDYDVNVDAVSPLTTPASNTECMDNWSHFACCRVDFRTSLTVSGVGVVGIIVLEGPITLTLYTEPHDESSGLVQNLIANRMAIGRNGEVVCSAYIVDNEYLDLATLGTFDADGLEFVYQRR